MLEELVLKRTSELNETVLKLGQEVLQRTKAEADLQKLNEELEIRVAERTEELEMQNEELQETYLELEMQTEERVRAMEELREKEQMLIHQSRQAAMGEMIGNIAHQWRQPLNALGLTVQQLLMFYDLGELSRDCLHKSVLQSMELIRHMSRTIDDFRNYFRPDKEKVDFKVREAITNTLSLIEDSFKNQRVSIEVVAKNDPAIYGYPNEFAQALLNILNNARDALTEREIDAPKVTITIYSVDDRAVVTVADNAGGIPEEIMCKIFDPYFTTKGPQHGTGVGLFMSKTIIEKNMGGRLAARNIVNGAEFRIEV
jgi:C4-dicarboxylate-specific signal transduction histidine kinase